MFSRHLLYKHTLYRQYEAFACIACETNLKNYEKNNIVNSSRVNDVIDRL